jgi:hypothetical protein
MIKLAITELVLVHNLNLEDITWEGMSVPLRTNGLTSVACSASRSYRRSQPNAIPPQAYPLAFLYTSIHPL